MKYAIQKTMVFLALSNLDASVNRTLSKSQYISVFMLCVGVTLVQWKPAQAMKVVVEQNPLLRFSAIDIAILCSGFAGVGTYLSG